MAQKSNAQAKAPTAETVEITTSDVTVVAQVSTPEEQEMEAAKNTTDEQLRAQGLSSLSSRIRWYASKGLPTKVICKLVKREDGQHPVYQHVRQVLLTPLKKVEAVPAVTA